MSPALAGGFFTTESLGKSPSTMGFIHYTIPSSMGSDNCIMTCVYYYCRVMQNSFTALRILYPPPLDPFPSLQPLATTDLFTVSIVLSFSECYIVGIIQYVTFSSWLLSLRNMHLEFLHAFPWLDSSLLFSTE